MEKIKTYRDGTYYRGEVNSQDNPDGNGYIRFPGGDWYEGEFVNNTLTGIGTYHYANGTVYTGYMRNASRHGKGKITWTDGGMYEGDFVNGAITGYGTYHYYDGGVYTGELINGTRHGRGSLRWADGEVYDGDFVNGLCEGQGTYTYTNGVIYKGSFKENRICGEGIYTFPDGFTVSGTFDGENRNGNMVLTWPDGFRFEAVWNNGVYCGQGKLFYPDGSMFEGPVSIEQGYSCEGQGVMREPDGVIYEGTFQDNQKNGVFTVRYPDGHTEIQEFKKDALQSVLSRRDKDGNEITQVSQTVNKPQKTMADVDGSKFMTVENREDGNYAEELKPYFQDLIGMKSVKDQLDRIYKRFKIDAMRRKLLSIEAQKQGYYFIVTGNPGTGKTTVARIIGRMLHDVGILPEEKFVEVDRARLVGEYIGQTEKRTMEVIDSARGGTLFIDEAYALYRKDSPNDFGKEAIDTLLKDMEDHRGEYCVIMAGYSDQMNDMIRNANPGLASRFDHKINIPDYSAAELADILVSMALNKNFFIKKEAGKVILRKIEKEKIDDTFDNARYARRLLDEAIERQALRLSESVDSVSLEDLQVLEAGDFGKVEATASDLDQCLDTLNSLIGLASVKKAVNTLVSNVRIQVESAKRGLSTAKKVLPVNMVFTGNPGTGKTTVARLMGRIYYHLGLLKRPDVFVECVRADLVGRYQGETALKVKEVVRNALGGVLFIDEAYSLVNSENDSFGIEAVNTLVSEIENNRDKLAVILAGYTKDMQEFLDSNPGLRSRLSTVIEFEDYSIDELVEIFRLDMKKRGYTLDVDEDLLKEIITKKARDKDFGNARGVRNICDEVISRHNENLTELDISQLSNEVITTITNRDLGKTEIGLLS
ncbi:MAG: AAA family ATPase [Erysipelotrichaceae bacterium]|nr:AAA family ATPase [Erysipelotrichaceae bacterium]